MGYKNSMGMEQKIDDSTGLHFTEIMWIMVIGTVGRLITPVPNITPLTGTSLFAGANLSKFKAILTIFITLLISDICLAFMRGYPIFGYFTLFTYSGFAVIVLLGSRFNFTKWSFPFYIIGTSCGFWVWTNFGVWLTTSWYPKTLNGLGTCYYLALPFLRNALIGDVIWSGIIFGSFYVLVKRKRIIDSKVGCCFTSY